MTKAPFIRNSRVSYPAWGESYGRGLAQSEDKITFEKMLDNASTKIVTESDQLFFVIEKSIADRKLKNPIVVHSLLTFFDRVSLEKKSSFIPRYRNDCPATPFTELPGFVGVLKCDGHDIPVISVFVNQAELKGRILVAEFKRFARWYQFPAVDDAGEEDFLHDFLLIQVTDLNADDALRKKILDDNPDYLNDKEDKDRYLRTRVVIKVFEKFKLDITDPTAGLAITVRTEEL